VESVGLGQSEVDIDMAVDMLLVIVPPGGGDSLQASKKGIMEAADMIVVNKADGSLLSAAKHTKADYSGAMQFIRQKYNPWRSPVMMMSARTGEGVDDVMQKIFEFHSIMVDAKLLQKKRSDQSIHWMWGQLKRQIVAHVTESCSVQEVSVHLNREVEMGHITPRAAAVALLGRFYKDIGELDSVKSKS
jgi:LAO/AO transport system kinase